MPVTAVRWSLVAAWLVAVTVASLSLRAYRGSVGDEVRWSFVGFCALAATLAGLAVRSTAPSARAALLSSLPALAIVALAGAAALAVGPASDETRGEPILRNFGAALLVAWAALVVSTAALSRARWSSAGPLAVTLVVAAVGFAATRVAID